MKEETERDRRVAAALSLIAADSRRARRLLCEPPRDTHAEAARLAELAATSELDDVFIAHLLAADTPAREERSARLLALVRAARDAVSDLAAEIDPDTAFFVRPPAGDSGSREEQAARRASLVRGMCDAVSDLPAARDLTAAFVAYPPAGDGGSREERAARLLTLVQAARDAVSNLPPHASSPQKIEAAWSAISSCKR